MGKRKEGQRRDDSSSSSLDAKRRRPHHCQHGPNDMTPWDGLRDVVMEIKDALLVKFSTEGKFKRKLKRFKEKTKKDNNKLEEDIRILKEELRILKENQERQKEGCSEASPQSKLSQSTTFRLIIESRLCTPIYKNEAVKTEDGGGHIKVVMYNGGSPIAPDHPLASVQVDLVVIEGRFNNDKRESWSKEEFEKSIITPREGTTRLVKNGTFDLIRGSCDHQGAIIMDNSQKKEVRLGVMITVPTEERVIEGLSNLFRVQEVKTKRPRKNGEQSSPPVPTRILGQSTSAYSTEQEDYGPSHPPPTVPQMAEGNEQALNSNGQNFSQQFPAQMRVQSASSYPMQHGQDYSLAPPNDLHAAGYCPINQPLLPRGQDQYTSLPNGSSELAYHNPSNYELLNDIQSSFSPEDYLNPQQTQMHETYWSFRCYRVLLQWDNPQTSRERWNFRDHLMPLYSTKSRFYTESYPTTSLMDKAHKLLASISSGDSVLKMITSGTSQATQTPQRRGVLIRPIGPYDSHDEPPLKKRRNDKKYQLRFVNRVCNDYYTREQIKSEDRNVLKVALYDENNMVVTSGPLSSASVEVVLLHGDFNAEGRDYWRSEEFSICLLHPQSAKEPPALGGDIILALTDGEADLGNVNFQTTSFHARTGKFKMGVVIKNVTEESVQEGITSPFLVRVRQGEEPSCHQITSLEALLGVRIKFPNQVYGGLERDAKENLGASSVINVLGMSTSSARPLESPRQGGGLSTPSALLRERKGAIDVNHPFQEGSMASMVGGCIVGGGGGGEGDNDARPNRSMSMLEQANLTLVLQSEPGLKCPRCDSTNTKFCYFNNYNVTQPRHLCSACRRYWTAGGDLRRVYVNGPRRRYA